MGGFCGYGGSVWVMGEWAVGFWIVGVTSFQKIYGFYGLKHHIVEIGGGVTRRDKQTTTMEDRATQPLGCWNAEFCNYQRFAVITLLPNVPLVLQPHCFLILRQFAAKMFFLI